MEEKDRVSLDLPENCGVPRNVQLYMKQGSESANESVDIISSERRKGNASRKGEMAYSSMDIPDGLGR